MKQLTQKLRDGRMDVIDVPVPIVRKGALLVRNLYSVISAGTEGSTVRAARQSLIGKARERPQQAKQMLELLAQSGPVQAYRTFTKKLDSYSPLGYSSAGVVIAVGDGVCGFAPGDKVACAGATANHSEVITVPENLCVKLRPDADLQQAAYNTLGAIALQGIRQADLRLGETCAVVGLGLLGQLACLLLRAGGIRVVGIDVNPAMVKLAQKHAADLAGERGEIGLAERIREFTGGIGVDAVVITAATRDTDPVNFAGCIARQKGKVVIVGDVATGFDREPHYYRKELDVRMSCSYGPGRYDPSYEEHGIDYPPAYVRWTEKRNMEAFQHLVYSRRLDLGYLTTHLFELSDAAQAYELIAEHTEPHVGIVLKYSDRPLVESTVALSKTAQPLKSGDIGLAFVGAGSYAMSHLLPNLPKEPWIRKRTVMTASGLSSRTVAERFGFERCTSDESQIFDDASVNLVFVATRHDTHAEYVQKALRAGKSVFVEKPLCINDHDLTEITDLMNDPGAPGGALMVGFNRRFSPLVTFIRESLGTGPMSMIYRVNAGALQGDSWIQDRPRSGGRIIGEACHFIDLLTFLNGSVPKRVQLFGLDDPAGHQDTVSISLQFANGSIGTVCYFANGPKSLPKEYVELYRAGATAVLRDFKEAEILSAGKTRRQKLVFQDKGQATMMRRVLDAVKAGASAPIPFGEIAAVSRATLRAVDSLNSGSVLDV
jgi:polar amino acid transport system substrate-binding protein